MDATHPDGVRSALRPRYHDRDLGGGCPIVGKKLAEAPPLRRLADERDVRLAEIVALEEKWLIQLAGERVREAIGEVEPGGMAAPLAEVLIGDPRNQRL